MIHAIPSLFFPWPGFAISSLPMGRWVVPPTINFQAWAEPRHRFHLTPPLTRPSVPVLECSQCSPHDPQNLKLGRTPAAEKHTRKLLVSIQELTLSLSYSCPHNSRPPAGTLSFFLTTRHRARSSHCFDLTTTTARRACSSAPRFSQPRATAERR